MDQINQLLTSVGAMSELLKMYYDAFIFAGFNGYQALELTKAAIIGIHQGMFGMKGDQNE